MSHATLRESVLAKNLVLPFFYTLILVVSAAPLYDAMPLSTFFAASTAALSLLLAAREKSLARYTAAVTLAAEPYFLLLAALSSWQRLALTLGPAVTGTLLGYRLLRGHKLGSWAPGALLAAILCVLGAGLAIHKPLYAVAAALPLVAAAVVARIYGDGRGVFAVLGLFLSPVVVLVTNGGAVVDALVLGGLLADGVVGAASSRMRW